MRKAWTLASVAALLTLGACQETGSGNALDVEQPEDQAPYDVSLAPGQSFRSPSGLIVHVPTDDERLQRYQEWVPIVRERLKALHGPEGPELEAAIRATQSNLSQKRPLTREEAIVESRAFLGRMLRGWADVNRRRGEPLTDEMIEAIDRYTQEGRARFQKTNGTVKR